jgi:hypothetical protein
MELTLLLSVLLVVFILLPFFVLRIRKEIILVNQNLTNIYRILGGGHEVDYTTEKNYTIKMDNRKRISKVCHFCGEKNRVEDMQCIGCGASC